MAIIGHHYIASPNSPGILMGTLGTLYGGTAIGMVYGYVVGSGIGRLIDSSSKS